MRFPLFPLMILSPLGCATVPSGQTGVLLHFNSVDPQTLPEGTHVIGPLDVVENYDLRAQERSEDLTALSADGAQLEAHASVITFHPVPAEVVELARETGPNYYNVLVEPLVRSGLRKVLAKFRADQLDTPGITRVEREVTEETARRLRPRHIVFDSISLRTLRLPPWTQAYQTVVQTGVKEQEALEARELTRLARQHADEMRAEARGVAASNALIAPTLSPRVLADAAWRAWSKLLTAASAHVDVRASGQPFVSEVEP
jgi:regulator of protease activity HflC (stomatin/prohibitin superfamily)